MPALLERRAEPDCLHGFRERSRPANSVGDPFGEEPLGSLSVVHAAGASGEPGQGRRDAAHSAVRHPSHQVFEIRLDKLNRVLSGRRIVRDGIEDSDRLAKVDRVVGKKAQRPLHQPGIGKAPRSPQ